MQPTHDFRILCVVRTRADIEHPIPFHSKLHLPTPNRNMTQNFVRRWCCWCAARNIWGFVDLETPHGAHRDRSYILYPEDISTNLGQRQILKSYLRSATMRISRSHHQGIVYRTHQIWWWKAFGSMKTVLEQLWFVQLMIGVITW